MSWGFDYAAEANVLKYTVFYKGGIDAKTIADHLITTTVNDTKRFIVTDVWLMWEALTAYSTPPQVNVGQTGATYQDLVNAGGPTVGTVNAYFKQTFTASGPVTIAANTGIYCRINSAGTGTTLTMAVIIGGYYLP